MYKAVMDDGVNEKWNNVKQKNGKMSQTNTKKASCDVSQLIHIFPMSQSG